MRRSNLTHDTGRQAKSGGLESRPRLSPRFFVLLLLAILVTGAAFPQSNPLWYQRYLAALDKINANDCEAAIILLKLAIADNPESARSPRYTPHYYLGLCYENQGDDEAAADCYAKEEAKEVIREFADDYRTLTRSLELIQKGEAYQLIVIDKSKRGAAKPGEPKGAGKASAEKSAGPAASARVPASPVDTGKLSAVIPATSEPPTANPRNPALTRSLVKYLSGDYIAAVQDAEACAKVEGPEKPTALFVAGASYYSLFLLSGETDEQARQQADRYFRACRGYTPPARWISPSILNYYRKLSK